MGCSFTEARNYVSSKDWSEKFVNRWTNPVSLFREYLCVLFITSTNATVYVVVSFIKIFSITKAIYLNLLDLFWKMAICVFRKFRCSFGRWQSNQRLYRLRYDCPGWIFTNHINTMRCHYLSLLWDAFSIPSGTASQT